jgi:D-alanyl-lipoteichoic acid acyltransferase DltB (MBOAT superfamily)
MTLSAFLRDYLYFPLGGNRLGTLRRYVNLGVVMVLGGLWHGAGWTFIAWGALHGFYLIVNHGWRALRNRLGMRHTSGWIGTLSAGALTFLAVVVGWVLFRSETMDGATNMLRAMAGLSGISLPRPLAGVLGPYVAQWPSLGIVFNGLASVTVNGIAPTVVLIGFSLAIVWLAPNVQQIFAPYQPTYEQSTHGSERNSVHLLPTRWTWEFRPSYGLAAGLLLFASLAILAAQRTSEFIYFQF